MKQYVLQFKPNNLAFTLVELALVILILGLIIGGVSAGTSLLKQSNLQSLISDYQQYQIAYNNFKNTYGFIPGDFPNAESYWPNGPNGCVATGLNCNGNGNKRIEWNTGESVRAMRQLYMAGMISFIPVQPNGTTVTLSTYIHGVTFPKAKGYNGGYQITADRITDGRINNSSFSPWRGWCSQGIANALWFGKSESDAVSDSTQGLSKGYLSGIDLINLEQKMDDGRYDASLNFWVGGSTGKLRTINHTGSLTSETSCVADLAVFGVCDIGYFANEGLTCLPGFNLDN